jgi:tight adherence protein B
MSVVTCLLMLLAVALWLAPPGGWGWRASRGSVVVGGAAILGFASMRLEPRWLAVGTVVGAAAWSVLRLWRRVRRRRSTAATAEAVLSVCELLAAELAAGRAPPSALSRAADDWPPLRPVAETAAFGGDVPAALTELSSGPGASGMRLVGAAWSVTQHSGRGLAEALAHVAEAVRADQRTARVIAGELASARATARLVASLPAVALLMAAGGGGDPVGLLFGGPAGIACLAGGLALGLSGVWWIESIADSVTS